MYRPLLLLAVFAVLGGDLYLHGRWTNRWRPTRELEERVRRLERLPRDVTEWRGQDLPLSEREVQLAEIAGYVCRRYENRTGASVTVLLLCGRGGPMAVHTPDVCYRGAGYQPVGAPARTAVAGVGGEDRFWSLKFTKAGPLGTARLRVYWAWTAQGAWQAPGSARSAFAGQPAVYKLYLMREMTSSNEQLEDELCQDFLRVLLPRLDEALFSGPASASP
jgi:hypothetical protein